MLAKSVQPPGLGAYDTSYKSDFYKNTGFSFSKDMRVFDKLSKEALKSSIIQKE